MKLVLHILIISVFVLTSCSSSSYSSLSNEGEYKCITIDGRKYQQSLSDSVEVLATYMDHSDARTTFDIEVVNYSSTPVELKPELIYLKINDRKLDSSVLVSRYYAEDINFRLEENLREQETAKTVRDVNHVLNILGGATYITLAAAAIITDVDPAIAEAAFLINDIGTISTGIAADVANDELRKLEDERCMLLNHSLEKMVIQPGESYFGVVQVESPASRHKTLVVPVDSYFHEFYFVSK
ncbi:MAG: hypothetical protein MI922_25000 [Bacteroidales bacterium]|nr:hypothetical protein [Bacteroidales bacterium]